MTTNNIFITGATGFLGKSLFKELINNGYIGFPAYEKNKGVIYNPAHCQLDLLDYKSLLEYCDTNSINSIIHLAATCGGIGLNQDKPADLMMNNLEMGLNILKVVKALNISKTVLLSTVCAYPCNTDVPFKEDDIWNGFPESTNAGYGIAKKTIMLLGQVLREQYGLNIITLIPVNLAGEYDHFEDNRSHVIPALIKKFVDNKDSDSITLWGDGTASREFLYSADCARAIRLAYENYDGSLPVNIGTGREITIKNLAEKIANKTGFKGSIVWDTSKPNGQPRRQLDVSRAKELFNFEAQTELDEILDLTIAYYKELT